MDRIILTQVKLIYQREFVLFYNIEKWYMIRTLFLLNQELVLVKDKPHAEFTGIMGRRIIGGKII
jgi:hypothetical protein